MNAVRDKIGPGTCGIIVEPIQGEGGVRPADMQFLRDLRTMCDEFFGQLTNDPDVSWDVKLDDMLPRDAVGRVEAIDHRR